MPQKKLREKLQDKSGFVVYVELTGGPGFNLGPIEKFLRAYKTAGGTATPDSFEFASSSIIPDGFDVVGIASPQNPGGLANIKPADVLNQLILKDLLGDLDFVPHTARQMKTNIVLTNSFGFGGTNGRLIFKKL